MHLFTLSLGVLNTFYWACRTLPSRPLLPRCTQCGRVISLGFRVVQRLCSEVVAVWNNPQVSFPPPGMRWSVTSWSFSSLISTCRPVSTPSTISICGSWPTTTTSASPWSRSTTSAPRNWRWAASSDPDRSFQVSDFVSSRFICNITLLCGKPFVLL